MDAKGNAQARPTNGWRKRHSYDASEAHRLRHVLGVMGYYPSSEIPGIERYWTDCLANLVNIICELDPIDISVLYNVARLLALSPRDPGLFKQLKARRSITLRPII